MPSKRDPEYVLHLAPQVILDRTQQQFHSRFVRDRPEMQLARMLHLPEEWMDHPWRTFLRQIDLCARASDRLPRQIQLVLDCH